MQHGSVSHFTSCSYEANVETEDTFAIATRLNKAKGILFGVFDGHSGKAASSFCRDELFSFLAYFHAENCCSDIDLIDPKIFQLADSCFLTRAFNEKRYRDGLSGACAIVSHVCGSTIITGNAGDCRCIVARRINSEQNSSTNSRKSKYIAIQLSTDHQIGTNSNERERILQEHPNESNVIYRNRVKGRLEPTRGFGDGKYKRMEYFLNSNLPDVEPT